MTWQDGVNGLYECLAGFFVLLNCIQLYKDKAVKGVSVTATAFFASWGYWNLYYYPHLDQWVSFFGGLSIVIVNTLWVGMMVYYLNRERLAAPSSNISSSAYDRAVEHYEFKKKS